MSKKLRNRIDMVARNLVASLDLTDADVRTLEDRVAALERRSDTFVSHGYTDLRTRIAAVIYRLDAEQQGYEAGRSVCSPWSLKVADAVIRELKLDQPVDFTSVAWGITSFDNGTTDE